MTNQNQEKTTRPVAEKTNDPRVEAVDRGFDAIKEYCKSDPKMAKRIGGSLLTGLGLGATAGGIFMITSTF